MTDQVVFKYRQSECTIDVFIFFLSAQSVPFTIKITFICECDHSPFSFMNVNK